MEKILGTVEKGRELTLPRKFDAVHRKTTTSSNIRPSVCLAISTAEDLAAVTTSCLVEIREDLEVCISTAVLKPCRRDVLGETILELAFMALWDGHSVCLQKHEEQ